MPCFFNCCQPNYCNRNFGLRGPTGPTGPVGPIGPIGPTGPTGTADSLIASFVNASTTPIATTLSIPLADVINLSEGNITHATGSEIVNLATVGTYMITYSATATSATAGDVSLGATLNGTSIANSISSETIVANTQTNLNAQFLITTTSANSSLVLTNTGVNATTYNPLNLVVQYLG